MPLYIFDHPSMTLLKILEDIDWKSVYESTCDEATRSISTESSYGGGNYADLLDVIDDALGGDKVAQYCFHQYLIRKSNTYNNFTKSMILHNAMMFLLISYVKGQFIKSKGVLEYSTSSILIKSLSETEGSVDEIIEKLHNIADML